MAPRKRKLEQIKINIVQISDMSDTGLNVKNLIVLIPRNPMNVGGMFWDLCAQSAPFSGFGSWQK